MRTKVAGWMEKFSAYRDPGTGIQPFLTPLPASGTDALATILLPIGFAVGIVRTVLILLLTLVYTVLVSGLSVILRPVPPLYRVVTRVLTAIIARLVLLLIGLWWIPVDLVARKRTRGLQVDGSWNPKAGDVIVSNWASWIEVLWLAFRFNPIFVLPVCFPAARSTPPLRSSNPITSTPGRRTGTGSAAISSPSTRTPTPRSNVVGFRRISLLSLIWRTGQLPPLSEPHETFESIRSNADRPLVIFPEGTTSNGRSLLRFAEVFKGIDVPVKRFQVFVMCVRYDPPTPLKPSLSHSIPSGSLGPLVHMFKLASTLTPLSISIRLLPTTESPSSGSILISEFLTNDKCDDTLSEVCASLMAQIGKVKRVGMGWEDKASFLDFYKVKR
ncbi:hypothetical protein NLI96_g12090 [Meripilus lineatus]|uniref:Phospholipid/glycerol acyltransferase domain-containing protein n=1 Tax=Meripilus lineatus TaxID=2056292 RepID=A0AAD5UQN0_9APHY|nr:hypothetical protein NLI96_g12090 [Physisporinus lineatus]